MNKICDPDVFTTPWEMSVFDFASLDACLEDLWSIGGNRLMISLVSFPCTIDTFTTPMDSGVMSTFGSMSCRSVEHARKSIDDFSGNFTIPAMLTSSQPRGR